VAGGRETNTQTNAVIPQNTELSAYLLFPGFEWKLVDSELLRASYFNPMSLKFLSSVLVLHPIYRTRARRGCGTYCSVSGHSILLQFIL
jgi:hypothetical protein